MSLALHYWMGDVHHCSRVSKMTYSVSSGMLNSTIPIYDPVSERVVYDPIVLITCGRRVPEMNGLVWPVADDLRSTGNYKEECRGVCLALPSTSAAVQAVSALASRTVACRHITLRCRRRLLLSTTTCRWAHYTLQVKTHYASSCL